MVSPLRAMSIKSALRDWLSVSQGLISILVISRCAAPPLSGCAGLSPRESVSHDSQVALLPYESCSLATPSGGQNKTPRNTLFINGSTVSTGYCATACGGKVVAPATKGGMPEWYMKYMTLCFSPQIPCFPLRGSPAKRERVYEVKHRFDTLSFS